MIIGMSMSHGVMQIIRCEFCGSPDGEHAPGCLHAQLDHLESLQRHIPCPNCGERAIGMNSDDYYECRKCSTQYSTGAAGKDAPCHFLDDPRASDLLVAAELSYKGQGNFPLDKQITAILEKMKQFKKQHRRRKDKK